MQLHKPNITEKMTYTQVQRDFFFKNKLKRENKKIAIAIEKIANITKGDHQQARDEKTSLSAQKKKQKNYKNY